MKINTNFPLRVKKEIMYFVNNHTNFLMLLYIILRAIFFPLRLVSSKWSIPYTLLPFSYFKLDSVVFFCRRGTYDFLHVKPSYEPLTTDLILNLVRQFNSGLFVDIGAHIGRYTILAANTNKKIKVVSIEANPFIYKSLIKNVRINNLSRNVIPVNVALLNSEKTVSFYLDEKGGSSTLISKDKKQFKKVRVKGTTLDSLLKNLRLSLKKVRLLKIDVEGAEYLVLKGASKTLKTSHPLIIVEVWTKRKLKKVSNLLSRFGYDSALEIEGDNYIFFNHGRLSKEVRKEILKLSS